MSPRPVADLPGSRHDAPIRFACIVLALLTLRSVGPEWVLASNGRQSDGRVTAEDPVERARRAIFVGGRRPETTSVRITAVKRSAAAPQGVSLMLHLDGLRAFTWEESRPRGGTFSFVTTAAATSFTRSGDSPQPVTADAHARFKRRWLMYTMLYLLSAPDGCPTGFEQLPDRAINGHSAIGVRITGPCAPRLRLWFDRANDRIIAVETAVAIASTVNGRPVMTDDAMAPIVTRMMWLDDFRTVNRLWLPFHVSASDASAWEDVQITSAIVE